MFIQLTKTDGGTVLIQPESIRSVNEFPAERTHEGRIIPRRTVVNFASGDGMGFLSLGSSERILSVQVTEDAADIEMVANLRVNRITKVERQPEPTNEAR